MAMSWRDKLCYIENEKIAKLVARIGSSINDVNVKGRKAQGFCDNSTRASTIKYSKLRDEIYRRPLGLLGHRLTELCRVRVGQLFSFAGQFVLLFKSRGPHLLQSWLWQIVLCPRAICCPLLFQNPGGYIPKSVFSGLNFICLVFDTVPAALKYNFLQKWPKVTPNILQSFFCKDSPRIGKN